EEADVAEPETQRSCCSPGVAQLLSAQAAEPEAGQFAAQWQEYEGKYHPGNKGHQPIEQRENQCRRHRTPQLQCQRGCDPVCDLAAIATAKPHDCQDDGGKKDKSERHRSQALQCCLECRCEPGRRVILTKPEVLKRAAVKP